jgi:hypothetical protein
MFDTDLATGKISLTANCDYSTSGPQSSFPIKNIVPDIPKSLCYLWDVAGTCSPAEEKILAQGTEIVRDFIVVGYSASNGTQIFFNDISRG